MKKFLTAILAVLYLTSSAGATIHLHYCMDKLVKTEWGLQDANTCCCNNQKEAQNSKGNCCHDENIFLKDYSAQMAAENTPLMFHSFSVAVPAFYTELPYVQLPSVMEENLQAQDPPRMRGIALYLFKQSFLI